MEIFGHIIGFLGMLCVVIAFHQTVDGNWDSQGKRFNVVNLVGAVLLIISLCIHFNLGSFVIEVFWIIISLNGLRKIQLRKVQAARANNNTIESQSRKAGIGA